MLEQNIAELIAKSVNNGNGVYRGIIISVEEAKKMQEVKTFDDESTNVYVLQKGEITIVVRLYETVSGKLIPNVKFICW